MVKMLHVIIVALVFSAFEARLTRVELTKTNTGVYNLDLYIGDPKVKISNVMIDTGSSLSTIPCSSCINCKEKAQKV